MRKVLIFHYVPGAGGKFIMNTLAYSNQVSVQDSRVAHTFLKNKNLDYLTKILLATIPTKGQGNSEWFEKELGDWQLWGTEIENVRENTRPQNLKPNVDLIHNNLWLPVIAHCNNSYKNLKSYFAKDQVFTVYVEPTIDFLICAIKKKWPSETNTIDPSVIYQIKNDVINIEHDFVVNNWDPRYSITQIKDLANKINIEFDLALAKEYTDQYQKFHSD